MLLLGVFDGDGKDGGDEARGMIRSLRLEVGCRILHSKESLNQG